MFCKSTASVSVQQVVEQGALGQDSPFVFKVIQSFRLTVKSCKSTHLLPLSCCSLSPASLNHLFLLKPCQK